MPFREGTQFVETEPTTQNQQTIYPCDHCGYYHTTREDAEVCCDYICDSCGTHHRYEEDAWECCAYYCENCGERHETQAAAEDCCYDPAQDEEYHDRPGTVDYPSELLDVPIGYQIHIPDLPERPARLCSLEQELSGGSARAAKLLHDLGIATSPYIENYSNGGHMGFALVKEDGSLPADGGEVVYSRFDLNDRTISRNFTEAIWRLRLLRNAGFVRTNRQAGTHIHISATSIARNPEHVFGPGAMAALYELFSFAEDVLFRLGSAGWADHRGTSYTMELPKFSKVDGGPTPGKIVQHVRGRHFSLNFTRLLQAAQSCSCGACAVGDWGMCNCGALESGTVEWRVFNASTKPETIHGWLILAHAMTAKALTHTLGTLPDPNGYTNTEADKHPWIFGWLLNELPMTDRERLVMVGLAKRSPGLLINWDELEVELPTLTDELDDEREISISDLRSPQLTFPPSASTSTYGTLPTWESTNA